MLRPQRTDGREPAYEKYVNPQRVRLLDVLGMNVRYVECRGAELVTADGRRVLDVNAGNCVHNVGHNHPRVVQAIKDELDHGGPTMLQGHVPELAGELAERLCARAGGKLGKVFFTSSGSEGIEAVSKFARAHTRRPGILYTAGGFHGRTCGALSLMDNPSWTTGSQPLLPEARAVSFGSIEELATELAGKRYAAFVVEPIQAEAGVVVPSADYLRGAQALCRKHGTLFVLDEVQTGLHRTGPFLAGHHFGVEPDMVVLAKALSGGLIPVGAVLMTDDVYDAVYTSFRRALVHSSTYGENALAMRAGLATMDVLEEERLGARATALGERLRRLLEARLSRYPMVKAIRGLGMLSAIEFQAPERLRLRVPFETFARIHPAMFGQVVVMRLFRDRAIFSRICGNDSMVLKVAPPLVVTESQLDEFVVAIDAIVHLVHASPRFWSEALGMARRVINVV